MAFIQGVRLDNIETRDQQHGLTKAYKKGRTFFRAATSFASGSIRFASPLLNILASAGVLSSKTTTSTHIRKGIALSCSVVKGPGLGAKIGLQARHTTQLKGADLAEHLIKMARNTASVALGIMTCFQLTDTIVSLCGSLSGSLGLGFKVVQGGVSATLPFIGVFAAIEIVKGMLEIGIEGIKLYKTAKKIRETTKKINTWAQLDWTDPTYISKKLEGIKAKQLKSSQSLERFEGTLTTSTVALNSRLLHVDNRWEQLKARKIELSNRNPVVRVFGQVVPQIKLTVAIIKKEEVEKKHLKKLAAFNQASSKHNIRSVKIRNYTIIEGKIQAGTINERDRIVLNHFRESQIGKYKVKRSNLKAKAYEHGFKIGLKTLVVISLVACMALTFSGVGTMPGIVTSASVGLFVMAAEYGLKKFKHYYPPKAWIPVHVPRLLLGPVDPIGPVEPIIVEI